MAITSCPRSVAENKLGTPVVRIRDADDVAVGLQMLNEFRHCLFGHLSPLSEQAHGRPGVVEVLKDHAVGRTDQAVSALGQPYNDKVVQSDERLPHQNGEISGTLLTRQFWNPA